MTPKPRRKKHPKHRRKERVKIKKGLVNASTGSEGCETEDEHYWAEKQERLLRRLEFTTLMI